MKLFKFKTEVLAKWTPTPRNYADYYEEEMQAEAMAKFDEDLHHYGLDDCDVSVEICEVDPETLKPIGETLRSVKFSIADFGPIEGYTNGSRWNGFLSVKVKPEVRDRMVAHLADEESDLPGLAVGADGLVDLNGYCTEETA